MSNRRVLISFPVEERVKALREVDLKIDPLPVEHALGVVWCSESESFQFCIQISCVCFKSRTENL